MFHFTHRAIENRSACHAWHTCRRLPTPVPDLLVVLPRYIPAPVFPVTDVSFAIPLLYCPVSSRRFSIFLQKYKTSEYAVTHLFQAPCYKPEGRGLDSRWPITVATRSEAWACGHSLAGIADSNPSSGIYVCVVH